MQLLMLIALIFIGIPALVVVAVVLTLVAYFIVVPMRGWIVNRTLSSFGLLAEFMDGVVNCFHLRKSKFTAYLFLIGLWTGYVTSLWSD